MSQAISPSEASTSDRRSPSPAERTGEVSSHVRVAEWIELHGAAVRGFLRAMCRRADVADDLWQEVFHRAWRASDDYQESGCARGFLMRIADRLLCDHVRSQKRRAAVEVHLSADDWRGLGDIAQAVPEDSLEKNEAARELWAALDLLSPAQRRVLLLRFYGELSFAEIASLTDRPLNTVLSDCRRGLCALRNSLGGEST